MRTRKQIQSDRIVARRLFHHEHPPSDHDDLVRDNCGACALLGRNEIDDGGLSPNYAGWERVYVQAGRAIPEKWRAAFDASVHRDGVYGDALREDLHIYYGMPFEREVGS